MSAVASLAVDAEPKRVGGEGREGGWWQRRAKEQASWGEEEEEEVESSSEEAEEENGWFGFHLKRVGDNAGLDSISPRCAAYTLLFHSSNLQLFYLIILFSVKLQFDLLRIRRGAFRGRSTGWVLPSHLRRHFLVAFDPDRIPPPVLSKVYFDSHGSRLIATAFRESIHAQAGPARWTTMRSTRLEMAVWRK
ncbi:uncharacterized protein KD926_009242 [Aspergillus affinis]|uniref:uncharacterized protein n=1 Tax=Aspergillus affinis TaxID=1070780 RepID=UPI0022FE76EB|nr:uncharacterized protein KD926_009242 [Aspergillus affinis]KAI9039649.1 hypothetical protein KD926_009242 [Aspergillus affinis]